MQMKQFVLLLGAINFAVVASSVNAQNIPPNPPPPPAPPVQTISPRSVQPIPFTPHVGAAALVFDGKNKEYSPKLGEAKAPFVFGLTNISDHEVIISNATTSCGCTVAKLPSIPWHLAAGANGEIKAEVNLAGKVGTVVKGITVNTSEGIEQLSVTVHMPAPQAPPAGMTPAERAHNLELAAKDRQTVFQDASCAECHVKKGEGKYSGMLYAADCGICHDSPNRAAAVPDLHHLPHPTDLAYWKTWIADSQPGKMMPAFAQKNGGPLNDAQIDSIAAYLNATITQLGAHQPPPLPVK